MKVIFLIFLYSTLTFAQGEMILNAIEQTPLKAERFVGIDSYGAIYFIKERTLFKKTKTESFQFKNFQLGEIGEVDLLNPLKITLFFPDYQTAVILDNKLNELRRIPFAMEPPYLNIKNASTATDDRLWVFNEDTQQLEIFNYREKTNQTLSRPIAEIYKTHKSNFNYSYVLTEERLRMYNIYGSLLHSIPSEGIQKISLSNEKVLILKNNNLFLLTDKLSVEKPIKSPDLTIKDLYLSGEFLYIYDGEMIHKSKLTKTQQ